MQRLRGDFAFDPERKVATLCSRLVLQPTAPLAVPQNPIERLKRIVSWRGWPSPALTYEKSKR